MVAEARNIALRKKALEERAWSIGEVLLQEGNLGVRDLIDESFREWRGFSHEDIGLTVLAVSGSGHSYMDSDDIRHLLPHLREKPDLREAVLSYDKTSGGPAMGRNFAMESPEDVIKSKWGRTQEGARKSLERAVRRSYAEHKLAEMTPLLADHGMEIHAYGKEGKPKPPARPATKLVVEKTYSKMPEGRGKILALLGSRVATVDDVLHATKDLDSMNFMSHLKHLADVPLMEFQQKSGPKQGRSR